MRKPICKVCFKDFIPTQPMQRVCSWKCATDLVKEKKKKVSEYLQENKKLSRLIRKADKRYQEVNKKNKPYSIISGKPTEAIHHRVRKSESNATRYYNPNGVPVTNEEHDAIHKRGKSVELEIDSKMGIEWMNDLQKKRREHCELNLEYIEEVIKSLEDL